MSAVMKDRPPREYVDFASVPPSQWKMHDRLENWAKSCRGSSRFDRQPSAPIFNLARSSDARSVERLYGEVTSVPVDKPDAAKLNEAIGLLPEKHRRSIHWYYLKGRSPKAFAISLLVPTQRLAELVLEARVKLIEMGA